MSLFSYWGLEDPQALWGFRFCGSQKGLQCTFQGMVGSFMFEEVRVAFAARRAQTMQVLHVKIVPGSQSRKHATVAASGFALGSRLSRHDARWRGRTSFGAENPHQTLRPARMEGFALAMSRELGRT